MSEGADYNPGPWAGHSFTDAYKAYDAHADRTYADARASGSSSRVKKAAADVLEASVSTTCANPLMILCDVTGSMGEWPKVIFSKLPYLEVEGKNYLGEDLEMCFGAIGDAYTDQYPLQIRPFSKGTALKDRMLELQIEGGGGGQLSESYELAALYAVHNVEMPNAIKPILIMIGDEKPYTFVDSDQAQTWAKVSLEKRLSTEKVFEQLKAKFSVYLIRKPYGRDASSSGNSISSEDREIRAQWIELLGADRVVDLPEAGRVVDVIFGILAQETGRVNYFRSEIEGRQTSEQVATVYKSLASIHKPPTSKGASRSLRGRSMLKLGHDEQGDESKPLL